MNMAYDNAGDDFSSIFDLDENSKEFSRFTFWNKAVPKDYKYPHPNEIAATAMLAKRRDTLSFLWTNGYYTLTKDSMLIHQKKQEDETINAIANLRLARIIELPLEGGRGQQKGFEFRINKVALQLFFVNESDFPKWLDHLKRMCVFANFHQQYHMLKVIGRGSFARVYMAEHKVTKAKVAVKAFDKNKVMGQNKGKVHSLPRSSSLNHIPLRSLWRTKSLLCNN